MGNGSNQLVRYVKDLKHNISKLNENVIAVVKENSYLTNRNKCLYDEMILAKKRHVEYKKKYDVICESSRRVEKCTLFKSSGIKSIDKENALPSLQRKSHKKKNRTLMTQNNSQLGKVAHQISMEWSENEEVTHVNNLKNKESPKVSTDTKIQKSPVEQSTYSSSSIKSHIKDCIDNYLDEYDAKVASDDNKEDSKYKMSTNAGQITAYSPFDYGDSCPKNGHKILSLKIDNTSGLVLKDDSQETAPFGIIENEKTENDIEIVWSKRENDIESSAAKKKIKEEFNDLTYCWTNDNEASLTFD